jgi:SAM-dependent methyltransferase
MEYDRFAGIFGVWAATAGSTAANRAFYLEAYANAPEGPVVEMGVGDGRLIIEAACAGRTMHGVEGSGAMLDVCRARAAEAGVLDHLVLIHADFTTFTLPEPAVLITMPYHTMPHLLDRATKLAALRQIHRQLRPGGRFLYDDFIITPGVIDRMREVQLRARYRNAAGQDTLFWVTSIVDEAAQRIEAVTWEDTLDAEGILIRRQYRPLTFSWQQPEQAEVLLREAGFVIEGCWGDFHRTPFDPGAAGEQVWLVSKEGQS